MVEFFPKYNIKLGNSIAYYPRGNELVESSNKSMLRIIKKMFSKNKKIQDVNLIYTLWVDRDSVKRSIGTSPFQLMYGKEQILPIQLGLPILKLIYHEIK